MVDGLKVNEGVLSQIHTMAHFVSLDIFERELALVFLFQELPGE